MAKKPTVTTVSSGFASNTQLNANFTALRDAFDNTLSLDGSSPNAMGADLDLNNNDLLNASVVNTATLKIGGVNVVPSAAAALAIKKEFNTVATLLADTGTYSSYAEDDYLRVVDGNFVYRVAASGAADQHVTTAGGVKLYVLRDGDGYLDATAFGQSLSAWQKAIDQGGNIRFPFGSYALSSSLNIGASVNLDLRGAAFTGGGENSGGDLFIVNSSTADVSIIGGSYSSARWGVGIRSVKNFSVSGGKFSNLAVGVGVNVISAAPFNSDGRFSVKDCDFSSMECGVSVQSCLFAHLEFVSNKCVNMLQKTITTRVYPLDKKVVSGLWYDAIIYTGPSYAYVAGNYVDGVAEANPAGAEPEAHGLAVHLNLAEETDAVMVGNHVRNVTGITASEGVEGILGRARRVVVSNNTLLNCGNQEGAIYTKGSEYSKVTGNIVEVTSGYVHKATCRGLIAEGVTNRNDVTGNKFIGLNAAIFTRATNGIYADNEFYGCTDCIVLSMLSGTTHSRTEIRANLAESDCIHFFRDATSTTITKGDIHIVDNKCYIRDYFFACKGADNLVIQGNYIKRTPTGTVRELILFAQAVANCWVKENCVVAFQNANPDGRVINTFGGFVSRLFVAGNHFEGGSTALWLRDQTYADLVVRDNQFFNCTPVNVTAITVTGKNVQTHNVNIDL